MIANLMLMVNQNLRVGVITGHIPLKDVAEKITTELILKKIEVLHHSLEYDFNKIEKIDFCE